MQKDKQENDISGEDEVTLLEKAVAGDMDSMEQIIIRYKNLVVSISRSYFLYDGEQSDLIQEGMIGLFKAIKSYSETKNCAFSNFARKCINRQIITAIKKSNSKKNSLLNNFLPIDEGDIVADNPEMLYIEQENFQILLDKINNISKLEKKVLVEFLDGKSYDEIAQTLGITKKSIDNALQRLKKKIR